MDGDHDRVIKTRQRRIWLNKQDWLSRYRIIEFSSVGSVIAAHTDYFAQWQINYLTINNVAVFLHYSTSARLDPRSLPIGSITTPL
jgi:hypothetical protein